MRCAFFLFEFLVVLCEGFSHFAALLSFALFEI